MNSLLFVCLGNICRSPLAEGIASKIARERGLGVEIDSAGTGSWHIGQPPCAHSIQVARKHGVDISTQRARQVTIEDLEQFDLIIALDANNYHDLKRFGAKSLVRLGDYGFDGADVPDPYFFPGYEGFEKVYTMIEASVTLLFDKNSQ